MHNGICACMAPPLTPAPAATEGARLLAVRLRAFPSQAAVAELLGCSQQAVSGYLTRVRPDAVMRVVIETALSIPRDAWFTDDERAQIEAARARVKAAGRAKRSVPADSGRHPAARPLSATGTGG